jgi:hypothetical protein
MTGKQNLKNTHRFGKKLGLWYPLLSNFLSALSRFWPSIRLIPKDNHFATDAYIGICWLIEIIGVILCCDKLFGWNSVCAWVLLCFCAYRFIDILLIITSILFKGFYRRRSTVSSAYRLLLLSILNAFEMMFLFSIFYVATGSLFPLAGKIEPTLSNLFDALYFSVTTGTTLGFGTPHAVGWIAKLLVMLETSIILLGVAVLIGRIAGAVDTETTHDKK